MWSAELHRIPTPVVRLTTNGRQTVPSVYIAARLITVRNCVCVVHCKGVHCALAVRARAAVGIRGFIYPSGARTSADSHGLSQQHCASATRTDIVAARRGDLCT